MAFREICAKKDLNPIKDFDKEEENPPALRAMSLEDTGTKQVNPNTKRLKIKWAEEEKSIVQDIINNHQTNPETHGMTFVDLDRYAVKKLAEKGYTRTENAVDGFRRDRNAYYYRKVNAEQALRATLLAMPSREGLTRHSEATGNADFPIFPRKGLFQGSGLIAGQGSHGLKVGGACGISVGSDEAPIRSRAPANSKYHFGPGAKRSYQEIIDKLKAKESDATIARNLQEPENSVEISRHESLAVAGAKSNETVDQFSEIKREYSPEMQSPKRIRVTKIPGRTETPFKVRDSSLTQREIEDARVQETRREIAQLERDQERFNRQWLYHAGVAADYKQSAEEKWAAIVELRKSLQE
ncbi:hypothetical protein SBOR_0922 [Sclerotinia borealis F-4128]|uniref:Uncharacterized protein n=1 Tax=Sclerotinia borealis (strain F-4128) TaxID=1432307 RepID=W9CVP7_SCLBF|nr:hypothetical protein SBOR_0922 [Sclerotinia borealis F-4128]